MQDDILRCYFSCRAVEPQYLWYRGTENTVNCHATPWCSAVDWGSGASSALRVLLWLAWTVLGSQPCCGFGDGTFHSWSSTDSLLRFPWTRTCSNLLPRDAMHKRGLCCRLISVCLSVRLSVCLSRWWLVTRVSRSLYSYKLNILKMVHLGDKVTIEH